MEKSQETAKRKRREILEKSEFSSTGSQLQRVVRRVSESFTPSRAVNARAVDRILKSRIKSDLSDFLTGRKPLLLWSF